MAKLIHSQIGVSQDIVRTISCSVDDKFFVPPSSEQRASARRELSVHNDEVAVCCLARLEPRKNQSRLIQAVGSLRRRGIPIRLLLAGDDIYGHERELRRLVDDQQCADAVNFLGFRDPRTVMWASDINALVSTEEGFGLVVIEGAMTGLPPLRSRSAGAEDQVEDGKTGLLLDAENTSAIAAAIERLAMDPLYRRALGNAADATARAKYSLHVMAREAEEIYLEAIRGSSGELI
jgi:glycosyltransferase involved in cell wall biosynthesis